MICQQSVCFVLLYPVILLVKECTFCRAKSTGILGRWVGKGEEDSQRDDGKNEKEEVKVDWEYGEKNA